MQESSQQEMINEIRKQTREQLAKWLVGASFALILFSITGWIFAAKPYVDNYIKSISNYSGLSGIPGDAVVAFDRPPSSPCPEGWTQFKEATSRMIIGAGNSDDYYEKKFETDEMGKKLSPRSYRQHGGEEQVTLLEAHIPPHDHAPEGSPFTNLVGYNGKFTRLGSDSGQNELNLQETEKLVNFGKGEAHNNMPPFIALHYCKKDKL